MMMDTLNTALIRHPTASEMNEIASFVATAPCGCYLQMPSWVKDCPPPSHHDYVHLIARDGTGALAGYGLTRITRIMSGFKLATIRRGPVVAAIEDLQAVCEGFADVLRRQGVCTLMLNPRWQGPQDISAAERELYALGARRAGLDNQPLHQATLLVDLDGDAATLTARFKQRARRQIKKAQKLGLTVKSVQSLEEAKRFEPLMKDFYAQRKLRMENIPPVDALFAMTRKKGAFLVGMAEDKIICGHVAIADGDRAFWLVMASDDNERHIPKNYPLVAEACRLAQAQGFRWYDMAGTPVSTEAETGNTAAARRDEFKMAFAPTYQPLVPMFELPLRQPAHRVVFGLRQWARARRNRLRMARA